MQPEVLNNSNQIPSSLKIRTSENVNVHCIHPLEYNESLDETLNNATISPSIDNFQITCDHSDFVWLENFEEPQNATIPYDIYYPPLAHNKTCCENMNHTFQSPMSNINHKFSYKKLQEDLNTIFKLLNSFKKYLYTIYPHNPIFTENVELNLEPLLEKLLITTDNFHPENNDANLDKFMQYIKIIKIWYYEQQIDLNSICQQLIQKVHLLTETILKYGILNQNDVFTKSILISNRFHILKLKLFNDTQKLIYKLYDLYTLPNRKKIPPPPQNPVQIPEDPSNTHTNDHPRTNNYQKSYANPSSH